MERSVRGWSESWLALMLVVAAGLAFDYALAPGWLVLAFAVALSAWLVSGLRDPTLRQSWLRSEPESRVGWLGVTFAAAVVVLGLWMNVWGIVNRPWVALLALSLLCIGLAELVPRRRPTLTMVLRVVGASLAFFDIVVFLFDWLARYQSTH